MTNFWLNNGRIIVMTYSTYTNKFLRFKAIKTYCSFKCIFCLKYKNNPIRPDCVNLKKSQIETNCRNKTVFVNKCDSLRATWLELKLTDKNHVIFWNHVVFTDVSFTCIGWPQVTSVDLRWDFSNYRFLVAFRIWCQNVPDSIPGAIFGKNVEIIKSLVPETGIRPKDEAKTWKWCQFLLIFECHDCSVFIPFIRLSIRLGSREVTWTTSDLISRDWRRIQFWKCSIDAFLRKIVKDEIEKLQNWIKFITKRFDPFWNIQKHPKWIFSVHSRQFGSVQNSGNSKNLEIGEIIQNDSMRLANSSLFFMVKYTRDYMSIKRFDWSGIRTHAPEEIGALIQRLRPLGHPVLQSSHLCLIKYC